MKNRKGIIAYIFGVLVFQEIIFRLCFPIPEVSNFNRINYQVLENDKYQEPDLFLVNKTWQSSLDTNHVFVHQLNEYGFRDKSWTVEKSKNKKRVLFIGDSFIEGLMTDGDNTIPVYYQALIGDKYEVMNAGMNGTGMSAYVKLVKDMVPLFQPDELKLVLFANDFTPKKTEFFEEVLDPQISSLYLPRLAMVVQRILQKKPVVVKCFEKTEPFLYPIPEQTNPFSYKAHELLKEVTPAVKKAMEDATLNYYIINLLAKQTKALKLPVSFQKELGLIKALCEKNKTQLTVYYLPGRNQVTDKYLKYDKESCLIQCENQSSLTSTEYQLHAQILKEDCEQLNLRYHDLTAALKKEEERVNLHWNYDEHMKSRGYLFIAETITAKD